MANFTNNFSWSKSRDRCFKECRRKYYFNHYGFWDGWLNNAPEKAKRLNYLKRLTIKEIWLGQNVHETIAQVLEEYKEGKEIDVYTAMEFLTVKMEKEFNQSLIKRYTGFHSKMKKLFEHEYGVMFSEEDKKELFDKGQTAIANFYKTDAFKQIKETPIENWLTLEDFLSYEFEGNTIYLSIDFAMLKDGKIMIYDWKTGGEYNEDASLQLTGYALYTQQKYKIPADKIQAHIVNVTTNTEKVLEVNPDKIDNIKNYMRESIGEMKDLLDDAEENKASEGNFEKNECGYCNRCNYKAVCKESL